MSAEKTPCISAIDTTNFARQIVLDFEFAPVPKQRQRRGLRNEIIEVGAVKLDYHGNVMGEFSQFVQTEFTEGVAFPVRELTGISAVDTAMADPLYVVIKRLSDWIGRYSAQVVCWSGADRRQLLTECQAKHIDLSAFPTDWADLQAFYNPDQLIPGSDLIDLNTGNAERGVCALPYVRQSDGTVVYFPTNLIDNLFLSNGMSAGNTLAEAQVQCLSEIFERAVKREILENELALPDVPQEVLAKYPGIVAGIQGLEEQGEGQPAEADQRQRPQADDHGDSFVDNPQRIAGTAAISHRP